MERQRISIHCVHSNSHARSHTHALTRFPLGQSLVSLCHDPKGQPPLQSVSSGLSALNPFNYFSTTSPTASPQKASSPLSRRFLSSFLPQRPSGQASAQTNSVLTEELQHALEVVNEYTETMAEPCDAFRKLNTSATSQKSQAKPSNLQKEKKQSIDDLPIPKEFFTSDFSATTEHRLFVALCSSSVLPHLSSSPNTQTASTITKVQPGVYTTKPSSNAANTNSLIAALGGTTSELAVAKLMHWMDIIEQRLVEEVNERSSSFMECTTQLRKLQSEVKLACTLIEGIRLSLERSHHNLTYSSLLVPRLCLRRKNLLKLTQILSTMYTLQSTPKEVESLLNVRDNVQALKILTNSERMFTIEKLDRLVALKNLKIVYSGLRERVEKGLEDDCAQLCLAAVYNAHEDDLPQTAKRTPVPLSSLSALSNIASIESSNFLVDYLRILFTSSEKHAETLSSVIHCGRLNYCVAHVTEGLTGNLLRASQEECERKGLRKEGNALPPASSFIASINSYDFSAMNEKDFISLFQIILNHCIFSIKVAASLREVLTESFDRVCVQIDAKNEPSESLLKKKSSTSVMKNHAQLSLLDLLHTTEETAENILVGILRARLAANANNDLKQLSILNSAIADFANFSQALCSRKPHAVLKAFAEHARAFLEAYSARESKKIIILLDNDKWTIASISPYYQRITDEIITGTVGELLEKTLNKSPVNVDVDEEKIDEDKSSQEPLSGQQSTLSTLQIGSKSYKVIGSLLMLLSVLDALMAMPKSVPCLGTEIALKIAQTVQTFNRRINQLILGAELTRITKTVKVISSKLLAITSQTLTALIDLLPFITSYVLSNLPNDALSQQQQQKRHFDTALNSLQSHNQMIFSKFVSILRDRLLHHFFSDFKSVIVWYCPQDNSAAQPPPSNATKMFLREASSLHKILSTFLLPDQLRSVFNVVFQMINKELTEILNKHDFHSTITGQKRLYHDMQFLMNSLGQLEGIDPPPNTLISELCVKFPLIGITTQLASAEQKKETNVQKDVVVN